MGYSRHAKQFSKQRLASATDGTMNVSPANLSSGTEEEGEGCVPDPEPTRRGGDGLRHHASSLARASIGGVLSAPASAKAVSSLHSDGQFGCKHTQVGADLKGRELAQAVNRRVRAMAACNPFNSSDLRMANF